LVGPASSFFLGADEGAVFDAGHVRRIGPSQEAARALGGVELLEGAGGHELLAQAVVFLLAAVAPVDGVGLAQGGHLSHPMDQLLVFHISRCVHVHSQGSPEVKNN